MVGEWVDSNALAVFTIIHFIRILRKRWPAQRGLLT